MTPGNLRRFAIARLFEASRERVWEAFTQAEQLAHWWGPKGLALQVAKLDLLPGGVFLYGMTTPDGRQMWGKFVYREIAAPERLEFVSSFCDEAGNIARHPLSATWPLETLTVVTFTENDGQTVLSLTGAPVNATEEEIATFTEGRDSMQKGFGGTFDQLAEYLAEESAQS